MVGGGLQKRKTMEDDMERSDKISSQGDEPQKGNGKGLQVLRYDVKEDSLSPCKRWAIKIKTYQSKYINIKYKKQKYRNKIQMTIN